jgi:hypothetical protein
MGTTTRIYQFHQYGNPDVLQLGEAGRNNAAVACLDLGSHGRFTISPMT